MEKTDSTPARLETLLKELNEKDAGGYSQYERLRAHMAGNKNAKTLVERETLKLLMAIAEAVLTAGASDRDETLAEDILQELEFANCISLVDEERLREARPLPPEPPAQGRK